MDQEKYPRFRRTEDGIHRLGKIVCQGEEVTELFWSPITTNGLCPKIVQVIMEEYPNGDLEKIRVLQIGHEKCWLNSVAWRKPKELARAIDIIKGPIGQIVTKQEIYLAEALDFLDEKTAEFKTERKSY